VHSVPELPALRGRARLAEDRGFTLIELLVVMQILAILVLVAVPTFLSTSGKARVAVTKANVRSAVPVATAYWSDATKNATLYTFGGLSGAKLRLEASGVGPNVKAGPRTVSTPNDAFCIQDTEDNGMTYYRYEGGTGGAATIVSGACPAAYNAA